MKIKYIIIAMLGSFWISGCEEFLDEPPRNLVVPEVALATEADVITALHGAYSILNDDGFAMEHNVIADASSDNGKVPSDVESAGTGADRLPYAYSLDLNPQFTAPELWREGYQIIAAVNNILEQLEAEEFGEQFEDRVRAESLGLRALIHFAMTQVYAQDYNYTADQSHLAVPYMKISSPGTTPVRNTMAEVYEDLFFDVNEALNLFESGGDVLYDKGYRSGGSMYFLSYYAVLGLRARLHFYSTDYPSALADANEIINEGGYSPVLAYTLSTYTNSGEVGDFVDQWYGLAPIMESEAIFQLDVDEDDGNFANRSLIDIYTANNGNAAHGVSQDLINLYEGGDARLGWFLDELATPQTDLHVFKYPGGLGINNDAHHFPVMRLTEFMLMAAECEVRLSGDEDRARTLVNVITTRAGASAIASSGTPLIEDIITERRKELCFEGHRLYDLKRLQRGFTRNDCLLSNGNCDVEYPTNLYAWPIPLEEINANTLIKQNPL